MSKKLSLYEALEASYETPADAKKRLLEFDYVVNDNLSTKDIKVAFNPKTRKLLFLIAGTHKGADIVTDVKLALGQLKSTDRYKQAKDLLKKAKRAYNVEGADIAAHSLGSSIASYISNEAKDKVYTYNPAATIGQKTRSNETAIRTAGDVVSLLKQGAKTIPNTTYQPLGGYETRDQRTQSAFQSHNLFNIKDKPIYLEPAAPVLKAPAPVAPAPAAPPAPVVAGLRGFAPKPQKTFSNPNVVIQPQFLRGSMYGEL